MSFLTVGLHQTVTHWRSTGLGGDGVSTYASPTTLKCRWEERHERMTLESGLTVESKAVVYLAVDVELGDFLFLGITEEANPRTVPKAYPVLDFKKVPGLMNDNLNERRAYL